MARPRKPNALFTTPSDEKMRRLKIKPQVAMPPPPPPAPPPELTPEGRLVDFPPIAPPPTMLQSMPLNVKLLADNFMQNPRKGLKTHADAVGMGLNEARRALRRSDVRAYVDECLNDAGASVEASCQAIAAALEAVRIVGSVSDPNDPKKKIPLHAPDHEYRLRAAEISLRLRGLLQQNATTEQPLTLTGLIMAIQQERQRRGLDQPAP